jgi:GT2 family glycosyltransferase
MNHPVSPPADSLPGKVAVIVLCFNERKWLDRCLSSVLATEDGYFQVFLVDNASSDGSAEFVSQAFPTVSIVRNATNLGFAGGNNEGIRAALAAGAEFVFLLNPDTWVEPSWLREMRAHFTEEPSLDVVTSMILNYEDDRFDRNFLQMLNATPGVMQDAWDGRIRAWYETTTGSGAALMARRSFYEDVGVIDPEFFIYFEEIDLLRRGRYHGKRIAVSTRSVIHHYNRLETPRSGRPVKIRFERGFLIFTLKDQFNPLVKCVIKFLLEVVSRPIGALFRREWARAWALLKVDAELLLKSPLIIWRRHLEMYAPDRLPEMTWLRPSSDRRQEETG